MGSGIVGDDIVIPDLSCATGSKTASEFEEMFTLAELPGTIEGHKEKK